MNRLAELAAPKQNRLSGLRPPQPAGFNEPETRQMIELSNEVGLSPNEVEPYYGDLKNELGQFRPADPTDPFAVGPRRVEDRRIGTIEQITRMDASDWLERVPFSPAGAVVSGDLMIAATRLRKDDYATEKRKLARTGLEIAKGIEGVEPPVGTTTETIAKEISSDPLRQADIEKIERFLLQQQEIAERGMTWGAKVFDGATYLPAWMIEFALTGGLAKLGSRGAQEIGLKTLQGYAKTTGGKAVLKAAGWTGAQITRATLGMPHRLADEIIERRVSQIALENGTVVQVDPESWATSLVKGWAANVIEVASESAGEGIIKGGAWVTRKTLPRLPFGQRLYNGLRDAWVATHPRGGAMDDFAQRFFDAAKFDGLLGEVGEERLATVLHAIVGTDDFGLGPEAGPLDRLKKGLAEDLKNLPVEAAVLAIPGGAKLAARAAGRISDGKRPEVQGPQEGRPEVAEQPQEAEVAREERRISPEKLRAVVDELPADDAKEKAKTLGVPISGGGQKGLKDRLAARLADLTQFPKASDPLPGETHPGSWPYLDFLKRWASEFDDKGPWWRRYSISKPEKPREMYKRLKEEYRQRQAWDFLKKAGQSLPESPMMDAMAEEKGVGREQPSPTPQRPGETKQDWQLTRSEYAEKLTASREREKAIRTKLQYNPAQDADVKASIAKAGGEILSDEPVGDVFYPARFDSYTPEENDIGLTDVVYDELIAVNEQGERELITPEMLEPRQRGQLQEGRPHSNFHVTTYRMGGTIKYAYVIDGMADVDAPYQESFISDKPLGKMAWMELLRRRKEYRDFMRQTQPLETPQPYNAMLIDAIKRGDPVPFALYSDWSGTLAAPSLMEAVRQGVAKGLPITKEQATQLRNRLASESFLGAERHGIAIADLDAIDKAIASFEPPAGQPAPGAQPSPQTPPAESHLGPTEVEVRRQLHDQAAIETQEAILDFFGEPAPADFTPREPTESDIGWFRRFLHDNGIVEREGYEPLSEKDYRDIYKFLQFPDDVSRSFPAFRPIYEIQKAREIGKHVLDRHYAELTKPYFDLSDEERGPVDRMLVDVEQNTGNVQALYESMNDAQRAGYDSIRKGLDEAAEMLVKFMEELGVREDWVEEFRTRITKYVPHKWYGDWRVVVKERAEPGKRGRTLDMSGVTYRERFKERDRLKAMYPNANIVVMKATKLPMEAFQDAPFGGVVEMVEQVIKRAQEKSGQIANVTPEQQKVIEEAWRDLWKSKGFGMHFIHRQETPGWTQDLRKPLAEYFSGFTGYLTKMQACLAFPEALATVDARKTPNLYKYSSEYIRYVSGDTNSFGHTKSLAYYWYLYGNVKSAVVNLSGNLTLGWPVLSKQTNLPLARMLLAMGRTAAGQLTAKEKAFLTALEAKGYLDPQMAVEISGHGGNAIYRATMGKAQQALSWADWFGRMEGFNRRSMAIALYDAGMTGTDDANLRKVSDLVEEAHHRFSKGNRPQLWRGYLSPAMTFRSWTLHYLTWTKNEIKAKRLAPVARSMAAMGLVGGLKAVPIVAPLLLLYRQVFDSDPEADAREAVGELAQSIGLSEQVGRKAADVAMRGLPSGAGVSLTGSVEIGGLLPEFDPRQKWQAAVGEWIGGVLADVPVRIDRVRASLRGRDYLRALEDASPEFLRNPLAAIRMYTQGAATRSGRPIVDHEFHRQMKLNEYQAILKSLGFQPDKLARQYEIKAFLDEVYAKKQALKSQWADRFVLAAQSGDKDGMDEVLEEIDRYNRRMDVRGRPDMKISGEELDPMLNTRVQPVGLPSESMLGTYERIWKQYYGEGK